MVEGGGERERVCVCYKLIILIYLAFLLYIFDVPFLTNVVSFMLWASFGTIPFSL